MSRGYKENDNFSKYFTVSELIHALCYVSNWEHTPTLVQIVREHIDKMASSEQWRESFETEFSQENLDRYQRCIDLITHNAFSRLGEDILRDVDERLRVLDQDTINAQFSLLFTIVNSYEFEKGTF